LLHLVTDVESTIGCGEERIHSLAKKNDDMIFSIWFTEFLRCIDAGTYFKNISKKVL